MLSRIKFLKGATAIVAHHHERWDGQGYPSGLKGHDIPLGARIFSVVDAYDAITSKWPYRETRPIETARAELRRGSGTQFDPRVVSEILRIPDAELIATRERAELSSETESALDWSALD